MKIALCTAMTVVMMGMATASFAGGPSGGVGTPDSTVVGGSSGNVMWGSQSASADNSSSGLTWLAPSGGKGGYPARLSDGCRAPGTPQDTGSSTGRNC
jgi:hypothetical protein